MSRISGTKSAGVNNGGVPDPMRRGYRLFFFAAFGWIALGGIAPCNAKQPNPDQITSRQQENSTNFASPTNQQRNPRDFNEACDQHSPRRDLSICASWRQIEAAEKANSISENTLCWNKIGIAAVIATLVATAWAAWAAGQAAKAAKDTIDVTWKLGKPQTEADIVVQSIWLNMHPHRSEDPADVYETGVQWQNIGRTVARGCHIDMTIKIEERGVCIYDEVAQPTSNVISPEVIPEQGNNGHFKIKADLELVRRAIETINANPWHHDLFAIIRTVVTYQTEFGDQIEKRFTTRGRLHGSANPPWHSINMATEVENAEYLRNGKAVNAIDYDSGVAKDDNRRRVGWLAKLLRFRTAPAV